MAENYEAKAVEYLNSAIALNKDINDKAPQRDGYDPVADRDNLVRIAQVYTTLATIPRPPRTIISRS